MNTWNLALFAWMGAGHQPDAMLVRIASVLAEGSTWLCAALIVAAACVRRPVRARIAAVLVVAAIASLLSRELAAAIGAPRPFMLGLSPEHLAHGARAGLPSTHATVMFTTAFLLAADARLRTLGLAVGALAVATGWARIYLGVHFPVDVVAGALLGASIAATAEAVGRAGTGLRATAGPRLTALTQALADPTLAFSLLGGFALLAIAVGLNTPLTIGPGLLLEGGAVANGTLVLYLLAAMCVLALRPPAWTRLDATAVFILLLALAARETDLHLVVFDISILKARFYSSGSLWQIALAILLLGTVGLAGAWLASRVRRVWHSALLRRRWRAAARTTMAVVLAFVAASVLDQFQAFLIDTGALADVPASWRYLMLSMEEILELALPVLVLLGLTQMQLGRHPTWLRRLGARWATGAVSRTGAAS